MNLDNVTLITVDGTGTDANAAKALKYSLKDITFKSVKLLTPSNKIYDYLRFALYNLWFEPFQFYY